MTLIRKKWVSWEELDELHAGIGAPGAHAHDDLYYREGDSPSFTKITLTQTTGVAPLSVSSTTLVDNLNSDLWDNKHLPALEGDKFLTNEGGLLKWMAMGAGEYHNLLSAAHPDTVGDSAVQGDIITAQPGAVSVNSTQSAGLGANVAGDGTDWTLPTNIYVSDNSRATVNLDAEDYSDYLRASTFGFSIPSNATIVGIKVEIEKSKLYSVPQGEIVDHSVKIVKGGSEQGDEKGTITHWPISDTYFVYGGPSDLWGLSWTYGDINASNFGVSIAAVEYGGDYSAIARVDHVRITVYYTIPGYAWKRLAKGTNGQILQLVDGHPAWSAGGEGGAQGPALIFDSGFDDLELGDIDGKGSYSLWGSWVNGSGADCTAEIVVDPGGGRMLRLSDQSAVNVCSVILTMTPGLGAEVLMGIVEWKMKVSALAANSRGYFSISDKDIAATEQGGYFRGDTSDIWYRSSGNNTANLINASVDTWYTVRTLFDRLGNYCVWWVDGVFEQSRIAMDAGDKFDKLALTTRNIYSGNVFDIKHVKVWSLGYV